MFRKSSFNFSNSRKNAINFRYKSIFERMDRTVFLIPSFAASQVVHSHEVIRFLRESPEKLERDVQASCQTF
jgi:competence transcription factor ComK